VQQCRDGQPLGERAQLAPDRVDRAVVLQQQAAIPAFQSCGSPRLARVDDVLQIFHQVAELGPSDRRNRRMAITETGAWRSPKPGMAIAETGPSRSPKPVMAIA